MSTKERLVKIPFQLLEQIVKVESTLSRLEDWLLTYNKKFIKDMQKIKIDFEKRKNFISHEKLLEKFSK